MTPIDALFSVSSDVDLSAMTYDKLMKRYHTLKVIDGNLDDALRDKYSLQYEVLRTNISKCIDEMEKRQSGVPRKSDPQTGNYQAEPLSDELFALENEVKEKYKIFAEAQERLGDLISRRIIDRIMLLFERAENTCVVRDGNVKMFDVQLPFPIDINGSPYRAIQCQKTPRGLNVLLYRYENHGRCYTPLGGDIAPYVMENLQRMGFWDDNYTFELGPM